MGTPRREQVQFRIADPQDQHRLVAGSQRDRVSGGERAGIQLKAVPARKLQGMVFARLAQAGLFLSEKFNGYSAGFKTSCNLRETGSRRLTGL